MFYSDKLKQEILDFFETDKRNILKSLLEELLSFVKNEPNHPKSFIYANELLEKGVKKLRNQMTDALRQIKKIKPSYDTESVFNWFDADFVPTLKESLNDAENKEPEREKEFFDSLAESFKKQSSETFLNFLCVFCSDITFEQLMKYPLNFRQALKDKIDSLEIHEKLTALILLPTLTENNKNFKPAEK